MIYGGSNNDNISSEYCSNVTILGESGNDYIYSYSGGNNSISGGAGNDTVNLYAYYSYDDDVKPDTVLGGKGDDIVSLDSDSKTFIQYTVGDGNDTIFGFDSDDTLQITTPKKYQTMIGGSDLYFIFDNGSITLKDCTSANVVTIKGGNTDSGGGDDTVSAGISVKNGIVTATNKFTGSKINLSDYSGATKVNASAVTKNISIVGNAKDNSLRGGSGNDTISGGKGKDYLTGGGADVFIYSGGNDIITDYKAGTDKIKIANVTNIASAITNSVISGSNVILTTSGGKITIKGAADKSVTFLNKNNSSTKIKFTESIDDGDSDSDSDSDADTDTDKILKVGTSFSGTRIDLTDSKYKNYNGVDASKSKKGLEIFGNDKDNTLIGGKSGDTLSGGKGTDTLTGGDGADIFIHSGGVDIITDYAAKDMIYLDNTAITGTSFFVNDLILYTGDNSYITIKNGKDKKITTFDSTGVPPITKKYGALPTGLTYKDNNSIITASKNFAGEKIDLADYVTTVKTVNAAAVKNNIEIIGNSKNNSLVGGSGSDTISGGAGNDTLFGGDGRDIFVHSAGDDIITDYRVNTDKIKLNGTEIKDINVGEENIVFTTSTGTLTINNGAGKKITIIDSDGNENTERYSANIAEILADNSVGEFENYTEKVTAENLITFAK